MNDDRLGTWWQWSETMIDDYSVTEAPVLPEETRNLIGLAGFEIRWLHGAWLVAKPGLKIYGVSRQVTAVEDWQASLHSIQRAYEREA